MGRGKSTSTLNKVAIASGGELIYAKPFGSRDDPNPKIYPFKLHYAIVPYSSINQIPVPVRGIVFGTGNTTKATLAGAQVANLTWNGEYIVLTRYMQVNHGVKPADQALDCFNCHGPTIRRMPWPDPGYGYFPEIAFTTLTIEGIAIAGFIIYKLYKRFK